MMEQVFQLPEPLPLHWNVVAQGFFDRNAALEQARRVGNHEEVKRLEDIGREFAFFRDTLGLIDQVEGRQEGTLLKPAFLKCMEQRDYEDGFLRKWNKIPLKTETGKKLMYGFQGYASALAVIMRRLRLYAFHRDSNVAQEAQRLLRESRLILEYRQGYTRRTGRPIDDNHRYVIGLWEYL